MDFADFMTMRCNRLAGRADKTINSTCVLQQLHDGSHYPRVSKAADYSAGAEC